jgi:hypothetical protein
MQFETGTLKINSLIATPTVLQLKTCTGKSDELDATHCNIGNRVEILIFLAISGGYRYMSAEEFIPSSILKKDVKL